MPARRDLARLRILQVIAPHRFSGAERIAVCMAQGLRDLGHDVRFACNGHRMFLDELAARGITCASAGISGKLNPLALWRLSRVLMDWRPDVIHTHLSSAAWLGGMAGRLAAIPVLAHVHALNTRTCFRQADMLAACSRGVRDHMVAQGATPRSVRVIYNGLDLNCIEKLCPIQDCRREIGAVEGQPVIGVAAHLTPKKGHRYLIEATARLAPRYPSLLCCVLGEGERRAHLESLSKQLGIAERVRFLGFRSDALNLMQAMDVVVLPSVAKEGLGLCLIEAGALGKPVVGSDAPGIREAIAHGRTGLLVRPADPDALAAAIHTLLADPGLRARFGEAGRRRVQDLFTLDRMVALTERAYRDLISARGT